MIELLIMVMMEERISNRIEKSNRIKKDGKIMLELLINALKEEIPRRWTITKRRYGNDINHIEWIEIKGRKNWYSIFPTIISQLQIYENYLKIELGFDDYGKTHRSNRIVKIDLNSPFVDPVKEILKLIKEN